MEILNLVAIGLIFGPLLFEIFIGGKSVPWLIHGLAGGAGLLIAAVNAFSSHL